MSAIDSTGAAASVTARLWGAADREPLPGIATRRRDRDTLTIITRTGHTIAGPRATAARFADPREPGVTVNGEPVEADRLALLLSRPGRHADRLAAEVAASVTGLTAARAAARPHPEPDRLWSTARAHHPDPSVYFEQSVVDGHPIHPLCRTREGVDPVAYAPEHHARVELALVPMPDAHLTGDWPFHGNDGTPLLPVHPLQLDRHPIPTAPVARLAAAPLLSLRTLAPYEHPHLHVKTALDVQLTSARRRVSAAAVHNGPLLSAVITEPGLFVQRELAGLAADAHGEPSPHLAAIVRESSLAAAPDHIVIPLAALAQTDPGTGRPLVDAVIAASGLSKRDWWYRFTAVVLPPLLRLAQRGIGLEAHGQNTLLAVRDGLPTAPVYRDFGGVRILEAVLPDLGVAALHGDLTTRDPGEVHTKLIAALYSVTLAQLVHALGDQAHWWDVATVTAEHSHGALREALFAATWPIKATTAMRLAVDPVADQWAAVANPIAGLA